MDLAGDGKVVCFREAKYLWDGLATLSGSLSSLSMLGLCPFELSGEKEKKKSEKNHLSVLFKSPLNVLFDGISA